MQKHLAAQYPVRRDQQVHKDQQEMTVHKAFKELKDQ